jgi:hypothetical protein
VVAIDHPAARRTTAMATADDGPDDPEVRAFADALKDAAAAHAAELRRRLQNR